MSEELMDTPEVTAEDQAVSPSPTSQTLRDSLSQDLQEEAGLKDFKSVDDLAKSYVHQSRMLGNSVRIPSEEAGEEQWDTFYSKVDNVPGLMRSPDLDNPEAMSQMYGRLGRPDTVDGYELTLPEELVSASDPMLTNFLNTAHDIGLSKNQAQELAQMRLKEQEDEQASFTAGRYQAEEILKNTWGSDYDNRLQGARAATNYYRDKYGTDFDSLVDGPQGNNPALLEIMATIAPTLQEGNHIGSTTAPQYGISAQEASEKIVDMRSNRATNEILQDITHPDHQTTMNKLENLYKIKNSRPANS